MLNKQPLQAEPIKYILFILLVVWAGRLLHLASQFPSLLTTEIKQSVLSCWAILTILAILIILFRTKIKYLNENINGILLALIFFSVYFLLASIFNQSAFDVDDIFFDADSYLWRRRFTTDLTRDYYFRPVHPFVLIIIRPFIWLISVFLHGNTLSAAFALNAMAGATCVFLVWYFVKHFVTNDTYNLLFATLFGASTAQLVFSSLIETYIFLATVALLFIVFLLKDKSAIVLIITGITSFGITISNFAQTVIAHFLVKRNMKQIIIYGLIVVTFIVPLTLLNNFIYPESQPYFWDLTSFAGEDHNQFPPTLQRANYLGRVMLLHSIVSPQPLILQEEIPFLKVWMFRAAIKKDPMQISQYETGLGNILAYTWFGFLLLSGFFFLRSIRTQEHQFSLALLVILLFNFILHMRYGKDVFLYSVNWTYALILLLALTWKKIASQAWFQISMSVFIVLLLINNAQLIYIMLSTSALHIK